MFIHAKRLEWLVILLCLAGSVGAQEKVITPSQKSKQAVDKLTGMPSAVGQKLQSVGKTVGAKLGLGAGEMKTAKVTSEAAPALVEEQNEEAQPPAVPALGKRDPFRPFTLNNRPSQRRRANLSPLERYELGQLKLVGVVWDIKQPNAIVEDAAGLGYVVRTGTAIGSNEGKVKTIQPTGLVIEEFATDVYGAKKKVERNMRLVPEKAE
ncbi:MAG: pilus assembly protein PilP [Candidatus Binatia bacterium]